MGTGSVPTDTPRRQARVHPRFEDVTQDGRLVLEALPNALGPTVWRDLLGNGPTISEGQAAKGAERAECRSGPDPSFAAILAQGIAPILSRLVLQGGRGPFSVNAPVEVEATCRLARVHDGGEGRIVLDMWADLFGTIGQTYGVAERAGERALAGRVMAEHVLTRLFAPPGQRRVTSLDFPGAPRVEVTRPASPSYDVIASLPSGATPLEPARSLDPVPIVLGLMHTDSNMHVNSLVYLRVFEEAALRRFAALGRSDRVLARTVDIAYRKPCFAGQTMRVAQQAFEDEGRLGVAAVLVEGETHAEAHGKPHAYVRMTFDRGA